MIVKTNDANYVKDTDSNAVINTNALAYKMYKQNRSQHQTLSKVTDDLDSLKRELDETKKLLGQILKNVSSHS